MTSSLARHAPLALAALLVGGAGSLGAAQRVPIGRYVPAPHNRGTPHPYAMTAGDSARSGRSSQRAPGPAAAILWRTLLPAPRLSPPALLADGRLALGSALGVHMLSASTGRSLHATPLGPVRYTPIALPDGQLIVLNAAGQLVRIDHGGEQHALQLHLMLTGLPLLVDDGSLVVGGAREAVHVLDLRGAEWMRVPAGARGSLWTARAGAGRLAAAGQSNALLLFSLHAGRERVVQLPERVVQPISSDASGTVFALGERGGLFGVAADGRMRLSLSLGERAATPVAIGRDGGLRVGLVSGVIVCLERSGRERWRRGIDATPGALTLDADDTVVFPTQRGSLYALEADGELRFRVSTGVRGARRAVIGPGRAVYVAGRGGELVAVSQSSAAGAAP